MFIVFKMCTLTLLFCTIAMIVNLNFISLNIRRGFTNKIDGIMNSFGDSHIIGLQETAKVDTNFINQLNRNSEYFYYVSNGENTCKGVITMVSKEFKDITLINVPEHFTGRLLHVSFKHEDCIYHVLNIYSPTRNMREQNVFYIDLLKYCETIKNNTDRYILLGDFNHVETILDTKNRNYDIAENINYTLHKIYQVLEVVDSYREKYQNKKSYTFSNTRGHATRIDKVCVPKKFSK